VDLLLQFLSDMGLALILIVSIFFVIVIAETLENKK